MYTSRDHGPTLPDLTTSWSFELMDSEVLDDLDFLTGAIVYEVGPERLL
jgi:hypothetical protein